MLKKILAAATAAAIITVSGCGNTPKVETQGPSVLSSGTSYSKVVAEFDGHKDMNITFGDFMKEYKYYLAGYQITDDTSEQYASTLTSQREYIINYLINEQIMDKKFAELGLSFTEEQLQKIDEDFKTGVENMKENFRQRVQMSLAEGETLTDEELSKRAEEEYQKMMTDCGLTETDFKGWQEGIYVQQALTDKVNEGFSYSYEDAEKEIQKAIEDAEAAYAADNSDYDPDTLSDIYIPDGSRYVQHILLKFADETTSEISRLRADGKDDEADKLRETAAAELSDKTKEVQDKVDSGEDFSELMKQYSGDGDKSALYLVAPGTKRYMDGFAECALAIPAVGGTDVVITDYGWHIIKYTSDAVVTEQDIADYTKAMQQYLENAYRTQAFNDKMAEWRKEYVYTIDRETLMLAEETSSAQ